MEHPLNVVKSILRMDISGQLCEFIMCEMCSGQLEEQLLSAIVRLAGTESLFAIEGRFHSCKNHFRNMNLATKLDAWIFLKGRKPEKNYDSSFLCVYYNLFSLLTTSAFLPVPHASKFKTHSIPRGLITVLNYILLFHQPLIMMYLRTIIRLMFFLRQPYTHSSHNPQ